jgi:hypothetical protein
MYGASVDPRIEEGGTQIPPGIPLCQGMNEIGQNLKRTSELSDDYVSHDQVRTCYTPDVSK